MKRTAQEGFTLIELLVAMGIVGILLSVITSWQALTINTSARVQSDASRLQDLNDVSGYLGDRVRSAIQVKTGGFKVNGGDCATSTPCLALLVPNWNPSAAATYPSPSVNVINECLYLIYRYELRSTASADDLTTDAWADSNTLVLKEYQIVNATNTGNCTSFSSSFSSNGAFFAASSNANIVADHLSLSDPAGNAFSPFSFASNQVTLQFQDKQSVRGTVYSTPASAPYSITVRPRNL